MTTMFADPPIRVAPYPRILCADDDSNFVDSVRRTLHRYRVDFDTAYDGLQAYASITTCKPDLILTDLQMPAATGDEVLAWIRGNCLVRETPVIVVSGCIDEQYTRILNDYGVECIFSKPVTSQTLLDAMGSYIELKSKRPVSVQQTV